MLNQGHKLRELIAAEDLLIAPAVYDCISAKVAAQAGFKMVFTSGFGLSASLLGKPDLGLLTATEIINRVYYMARSIDIPMIADLDTGYGGVLNVVRTIEEVVVAGAGGVILEDQVWPKRCGHFDNKEVVSAEEHAQKIKAAVDARADSGLVIVARTDSLATHGLTEAIERGKRYADAGADIIFIEAPQSLNDIETIAKELDGLHLFANMIEGGKTPLLTRDQLIGYGFKVCAYALTGLFAATQGLQNTFNTLASTGEVLQNSDQMNFDQFKEIIDLKSYMALMEKFK